MSNALEEEFVEYDEEEEPTQELKVEEKDTKK
jgi:hypothetical protein